MLLQFNRISVGSVDYLPGKISMLSTDNLTQITTSGYLHNSSDSPAYITQLSQSDVIECLYNYNKITKSGNFIILQASISSGIITLNPWINPNIIAISNITNPDPQSDLIWYDISCSAASLASGGKVNVQTSSGSKQYVVRDLRVNYTSSGLSGGSGNRNLIITDGTTTWNGTGVTNTLLVTPANTVWGASGNPIAATQSMNNYSVAGSNIYFQLSGGTADYTTGNVLLSVLVQRVA